MSVTLPTATEADIASNIASAAAIAAAEASFVAEVTVMINQAILNGLFMVQPFLPTLVTPNFVTTYFQAQGYTVLFPIIPPGPYNPAFVPGFPEVLPPGYNDWGISVENFPGLPRIQISWVGA